MIFILFGLALTLPARRLNTGNRGLNRDFVYPDNPILDHVASAPKKANTPFYFPDDPILKHENAVASEHKGKPKLETGKKAPSNEETDILSDPIRLKKHCEALMKRDVLSRLDFEFSGNCTGVLNSKESPLPGTQVGTMPVKVPTDIKQILDLCSNTWGKSEPLTEADKNYMLICREKGWFLPSNPNSIFHYSHDDDDIKCNSTWEQKKAFSHENKNFIFNTCWKKGWAPEEAYVATK